jgi:hypothetical protein
MPLDLAHDVDNRNIDLESAIADAVVQRREWTRLYLSYDWESWSEARQIAFLMDIPRLPLRLWWKNIN